MLHLGSNSKGEIIKKEFPLGLQRAEEAFAFGDFRVWMHLTVLIGGRRLSVAVALRAALGGKGHFRTVGDSG